MAGPSTAWFRRPFALRAAAVLFAVLPAAGLIAQEASAPADQARGSGEEHPSDGTRTPSPELTQPVGKDAEEALCLLVESAAKANDLPLEFFARVIWQESRFQSQVVGPVTRTGQRALGIAQFMPGTARERGLLDPFNPVQALPKAAEFLAELRDQFGNLGLAAAAYNAGPRRVQEWLAGTGGMPAETRNYVLAITGSELEKWATVGNNREVSDGKPKTSCRELVALLKREPNRFVSRLEQSVARGVTKPWGVQVASGFNRDQALAMYARGIKDFNAVIGGQQDPDFQPILFHVRGTRSFYQVRIGTNTRREADNLCKRIRLAHGACLVKPRSA
jgi:Transglycosylase SLT domain/SPOR domain